MIGTVQCSCGKLRGSGWPVASRGLSTRRVSLSVHSAAHAELAFVLAMLFGIAWLFYRSQPR